jgi:hypothetical protein
MRDGLVSFERVRDWEALECQRHICEIQGASGAMSEPCTARITGCTDRQGCMLVVWGASVAWI